MSQNGLTIYSSDTVSALKDVGTAISRSGIVRGCESPELGMMFAMTAANRNTDILSLAQKFEFVNGRLSMPAKVMLSEFHLRGGRHEVIERSPDAAAIKLIKDGQEQVFRLTWEDAKWETFPYSGKEAETLRMIEARNEKELAKRLKPKYATPRSRMQMLWARVISDGVGAFCPEVNSGVYTPEEIEDFEEPCSASQPVVKVESPPATQSPAGASQVIDEVEDADFDLQSMASADQIRRMTQLFTDLGIDAAGQMKAFKSVGADSMASVTSAGAVTIIGKMESRLAQQAPSPPAVSESAKVSDDGAPSTADQIEVIKGLIETVSQKPGHGDIPRRIKEHLNRHGITKMIDLSALSAQSLIDSLNGTTGLEDFFDVPPNPAVRL